MKNLYTMLFEFTEGTYVSQIEAESEEGLVELWLTCLKETPLDHKAAPTLKGLKTVMDYFNNQVYDNDMSFEDQIRAELKYGAERPASGRGSLETLTGLENAFCETFLIELTEDQHDEECSIVNEALWIDVGATDWEAPDWDEDDCPRCKNDKLGELYVIKTVKELQDNEGDTLKAEVKRLRKFVEDVRLFDPRTDYYATELHGDAAVALGLCRCCGEKECNED